MCKLISCCITIAFLAVGAFLIWTFIGRPDLEDVKDGLGNIGDTIGNTNISEWGDVLSDGIKGLDFSDLMQGDAFLGSNSTSEWPNNGAGLELTLQNALNDDWHDEFTVAMEDWDNGTPDALSLTEVVVEVDNKCKQVDGVMLVCNNNFGDTGWLGLNEILKTTGAGIIQSSVAKMNEYYLANSDNAERQYTMCHEIGHGFGLPHTDESFNNPSLGNCLDYTHTPADNMHPDETNFRRLVSVYGTVGGGRRRQERRQRNLLRGMEDTTTQNLPQTSIPPHRRLTGALREEYERAVKELESPIVVDADGATTTLWRKLREHDKGVDLVRRLGEEHVLEVHMLYPLN